MDLQSLAWQTAMVGHLCSWGACMQFWELLVQSHSQGNEVDRNAFFGCSCPVPCTHVPAIALPITHHQLQWFIFPICGCCPSQIIFPLPNSFPVHLYSKGTWEYDFMPILLSYTV